MSLDMEFRIDIEYVCVYVCMCVRIYIYIERERERERLGYGLDDRGSVSGRVVMSIIYAVASRTAVGSTFPGALTLQLKRLGVKLTTHFHLVPRLRMRGAVPPLPTSSWRVV
jgi:hypothetical protein